MLLLNKWFVVHDLLAYQQHPDLISNIAMKTRVMKPKFKNFGKIQQGDLIAYYATKDNIIVGVFKVTSEIYYLHQDPYWGDVMVFDIEPFKMPPKGKYLDFKKVVTDPDAHFDIFPAKNRWGTYIQGKTCLSLSEMDYSIIENAFSQEKFMRDINKIKISPTRWHKKYGKKNKFDDLKN